MIAIDKECKYCKISFEDGIGFKKIGKHIKHTHNKTMLEMYMDVGLITEEDFPICNGCGEKIDLKTFVRAYKVLQDPNKDYYHNNECKSRAESYHENLRKSWQPRGWAEPGFIRTPEADEKRRHGIIRKHATDPSYRLKQSLAKLGKKNSPEHCANISKGRKGIKFTAEHRDNLSKAISKKMSEGWHMGIKNTYTTKSGRILGVKSSYELLMSWFLDNCEDVLSWRYEPIILKNELTNKRYLPDFLVEYKNGEKHLIEVDRYLGFKEDFNYNWKIELGKKYAIDNGLIWKVYDFDMIIDLYKKYDVPINLTMLVKLSKNTKSQFNLKRYLYMLSIYNKLKIDEEDLNYPELNVKKDFEFKKIIHASRGVDPSKFWILANNPSFFNARWSMARWSAHDSLTTQIGIVGIIKNLQKLKKKEPITAFSIIKQSMNERYTVSFFPAWWVLWLAKGIQQEYNFIPRSILDPSAGWGGRLVGWYQFDNSISYTGIDPNVETINGLENISNKLNYNAELHPIKFQDFDCNNKQYDLAMTSPPYWDREIYAKGLENEIDGYYEKLNSVHCKYVVLNIGSKDWEINKDRIITILTNYKLIDEWRINLSLHPFQKKKEQKFEGFYIFKYND